MPRPTSHTCPGGPSRLDAQRQSYDTGCSGPPSARGPTVCKVPSPPRPRSPSPRRRLRRGGPRPVRTPRGRHPAEGAGRGSVDRHDVCTARSLRVQLRTCPSRFIIGTMWLVGTWRRPSGSRHTSRRGTSEAASTEASSDSGEAARRFPPPEDGMVSPVLVISPMPLHLYRASTCVEIHSDAPMYRGTTMYR